VGQFFVLPDNGLLTFIQDRDGIVEAREIANPAWMIGSGISSTFHGRDIFSPAGAHLARGDDWTTAGPALDVAKLVRLDLKNATVDATGLHGQVVGTDGPFGNLVLNVPAETFAQLGYKLGDRVPVTLDGKHFVVPFVKTFSDVPVGKELLYIDSRGRLSLGINQRNFAETYIDVNWKTFKFNGSERQGEAVCARTLSQSYFWQSAPCLRLSNHYPLPEHPLSSNP
jgi:S-adenosylmethionine hydrolase